MLPPEKLTKQFIPEQVLLVLLARLYFKRADTATVQLFIDNARINWDLFYNLIKSHQVRPFVYSVITSHRLSTAPEFIAALKAQTQKISLACMHQLRYTQHLQQEAAALGICLIPYKGVVSGNRYYGDIHRRESTDIDFLVNKDDVEAIRKYLYEQHYTPQTDVPDDYISYMKLFHKDISFRTPPDALQISCSVEIQWRLVDRFDGRYPAYSFFADHLTDVAIGSKTIRALDPTYDFICVCSNHVFKEHFNKFKYVLDIACMIAQSNGEIDRQTVANVIENYRLTKFFNRSFGVLYDLLGIAYDNPPVENTNDEEALNDALAFPLKRKLNRDQTIYDLQTGTKDKIKLTATRLLFLVLPNYTDIATFRLPFKGLPLLIVARLFRLLFKRKPW
jgi:hypothetical protein